VIFDKYSEYIPFNQGVAYLAVLLTWFVPISSYRDYPEIFGENPFFKLIVIACIGGIISFVLWAKSGNKFIAALAGLVAGFGVGISITYFLDLYGTLGKTASAILICIGMIPGLILMWVLQRARN
jgi:hypothetical protein